MDKFRFAPLALLLCLSAPALAGPVRYTIASPPSVATAQVAFFGVARKTARFPVVTGQATLGSSRDDAIMLDVTLDATRLTANDDVTERRLKGPNFFNVARNPLVRFNGKRIRRSTARNARIGGQLTVRGITRAVTLDVRFSQPIDSIDGRVSVTIDGTTTINRRDFGIPLIR